MIVKSGPSILGKVLQFLAQNIQKAIITTGAHGIELVVLEPYHNKRKATEGLEEHGPEDTGSQP